MEWSQKRSFNTKDSTFEVGSVVKDPEDRKYLILRFCEGGAEPEALLQCDDTKDYVRKSIFDLFPQPEQLQAQVADDLFQQLLSKDVNRAGLETSAPVQPLAGEEGRVEPQAQDKTDLDAPNKITTTEDVNEDTASSTMDTTASETLSNTMMTTTTITAEKPAEPRQRMPYTPFIASVDFSEPPTHKRTQGEEKGLSEIGQVHENASTQSEKQDSVQKHLNVPLECIQNGNFFYRYPKHCGAVKSITQTGATIRVVADRLEARITLPSASYRFSGMETEDTDSENCRIRIFVAQEEQEMPGVGDETGGKAESDHIDVDSDTTEPPKSTKKRSATRHDLESSSKRQKLNDEGESATASEGPAPRETRSMSRNQQGKPTTEVQRSSSRQRGPNESAKKSGRTAKPKTARLKSQKKRATKKRSREEHSNPLPECADLGRRLRSDGPAPLPIEEIRSRKAPTHRVKKLKSDIKDERSQMNEGGDGKSAAGTTGTVEAMDGLNDVMKHLTAVENQLAELQHSREHEQPRGSVEPRSRSGPEGPNIPTSSLQHDDTREQSHSMTYVNGRASHSGLQAVSLSPTTSGYPNSHPSSANTVAVPINSDLLALFHALAPIAAATNATPGVGNVINNPSSSTSPIQVTTNIAGLGTSNLPGVPQHVPHQQISVPVEFLQLFAPLLSRNV